MSFGKLTAAGASTDVLNARVRLPGWGTWSALVTLARGDSTLTGPVVLTLGPLVLSGTIRRGSPFVGRGSYRIFGGADGWPKTVPAISYRNPQTTLSKLAQDVAAVVGESIVMDTAGDRGGPVRAFERSRELVAEHLLALAVVGRDRRHHAYWRPDASPISERARARLRSRSRRGGRER